MRNPADVERPARLGHGEADGNKLRKLAGGPAISLNELNELADAEPLVIYRQFYNRYRGRGIVRFNRGLNVRDAHAQLHPQDVEAAGSRATSAAFSGELMYMRARKVAEKIAACLNKDFEPVLKSATAISAAQVTRNFQDGPTSSSSVVALNGADHSAAQLVLAWAPPLPVPSCKTCFTWFLAAIAAGKLG